MNAKNMSWYTERMASSNGTPPPSVFAGMPTVSLLEAVVTKDPRWHWLEATWDESDGDSTRELACFVREHRATLAKELAGHVRSVIARPESSEDDPVLIDSEGSDLSQSPR